MTKICITVQHQLELKFYWNELLNLPLKFYHLAPKWRGVILFFIEQQSVHL